MRKTSGKTQGVRLLVEHGSVLRHTLQRLEDIDRHFSPAVLANAFGPESMVMTDLIHKHGLGIEIISLDTGRLPEETHDLANNIHRRYGAIVRLIGPDPDEVADWTSRFGQNGFYESVELRRGCCGVRKVSTLQRELVGKRAWLTGLRREHSVERASLVESHWDATYGLQKFNPMIDWSDEQVWGYIHQHSVPYNRLHDRGYTSIGCAPCTRAVTVGEDMRSGRWWWEQDTVKECGLHVDPETGRVTRARQTTVTLPAPNAPAVHDSVEVANEPRTNEPWTNELEANELEANELEANELEGSAAMRVLVLGGDGFCGWPTALHLSAEGHQVAIVDNLSRRKIDLELECESLTPIRPIGERLRTWKEVSGKDIEFHNFDVAVNYQRLVDLIEEWKPTAIVHFAEQRAAPYSMKSSRHKRYTVSNNINATNNVLAAVVDTDPDIHVVHLGTMGVYGYGTAGMKIPEGYLKVSIDNGEGVTVENEILYPANPGSIYHMTKTQDQLLFFYYNKNDGIRVTDLHQGIVWGTQTRETKLDDRLINRFDYDGDYGTVLNRFLMQAGVGYPLTVHGTGGQTRAFIHIQDTVRCIELALENAPEAGERVQIFNQMTETHRIRDLAKMISDRTGVSVDHIPNPRVEADENDLHVVNDRFLHLGLTPITLNSGLMEEVTDVTRKHVSRCDTTKIPCLSFWRKPLPEAAPDVAAEPSGVRVSSAPRHPGTRGADDAPRRRP